MKTTVLNDSFQYVTDKSFVFQIGAKQHQFGVLFEITDMLDATGEKEYEGYPFVVSASIVVNKPHKSFGYEIENDTKVTNLMLIEECYRYMGGVPVDHILQNRVKSSIEGVRSAFDVIASQFNIGEACVKTYRADFGTVAAQEGKGTEVKVLQFVDEKSAQKYLDYLVKHRLSAISMMIGFILDAPINMAGHDGWSQIEAMLKGI